MSIPEYILRSGKEKRLAAGHAWAFRNEIDFGQKDPGPGALVRLKTAKGRPIGVGFLNSYANLCFRLIARHGEFPIDATVEALLEARLEQAIALRQRLGLQSDGSQRLVNAEGDFLPGLIVDSYHGALVVQINGHGMERHREFLLNRLRTLTNARAVIERGDEVSRTKEGLKPSQGVRHIDAGLAEDSLRHWRFQEGPAVFDADLLEGSKTGFFLDQRPARELASHLSRGQRCLDVFCNTGGFAVRLAQAGASKVEALDQSAPALARAAEHAVLNGMQDKIHFERGDAFVRMREIAASGERYGLIVLDPPAMAKEDEALIGALRGYKELNLRAFKALEPGGLLLTCSCTGALDDERFDEVLQSAAQDAGCAARETHRLGAGPDHPSVPGMPESRYLKVRVLRKD